MGIELDVLVGHPDHDLLFVATQVAKRAGLKNAKVSASSYLKQAQRFATGKGMRAGELVGAKVQHSCTLTEDDIRGALPYPRWRETWLIPEDAVYRMLLRGSAPQAEPFRKWVTEEVLPTIRKTGKYDAAESENPIAQGVMDELKGVRGELAGAPTWNLIDSQGLALADCT